MSFVQINFLILKCQNCTYDYIALDKATQCNVMKLTQNNNDGHMYYHDIFGLIICTTHLGYISNPSLFIFIFFQ